MDRIKVVHIAQANGGIERYLEMFFKYFKNDKYENYLILSKQYKESIKKFEGLGLKVYIIDMIREISIIKDIKASFDIYKILKDIKPKIVYTHSSKAGGVGRIPAKLCKCINIYNPHGWAFDINTSREKKYIFKSVERVLSIFTDKVIAISEYEKEIAIENKIVNKSKITKIENAIDLELFNEVNNSTQILRNIGWNKENIVIGMVARISKQKSPKTFVNIASMLAKYDSRIRFIIVGDGEQRREIEELIRENGLEKRFYITGWVNNVREYINIFDIALLTSKWEGFGLVIPEYMAAMKPVIASNVGGISNIIENNVNGLLVNGLDEEKFVEKIIFLLENKEFKNKIVDQGKKTVFRRYNFKRVIEQHETTFEEIL